MTEIPGYNIYKEISHGYHYHLYKGTRNSDKRNVLIKSYDTVDITYEQIVQFKKDCSTFQKQKSQGLSTVYAFESHKKNLALILEDFTGIPLKEYFQKTNGNISIFLNIAIELAQALSEIHQVNLIHKDLKPKNISINQETGNARIIDPGISSILTREIEDIYNNDVLNDTLPYISPEQTGRMNRIIDYRTDFYSLGIIFYETLSGHPLFPANDPLEIFHNHIAKMPVPLNMIKPEIPKAISNIILKMISKNPEDRYISGYGLKSDFEECLDKIESNNEIWQFTPGRNDLSNRLVISQKIYGRRKEIDILMSAFERVSHGITELIMVKGHEGIGKTSLINEIQKHIVKARGYCISGKFDRLNRDKPYLAIIQAFQSLIKQILTENEKRIEQWKDLLKMALGKNGRIITDVVPELELLIGKQPEVQKVGLLETQNRFNMLMCNFISVIATKNHSIVLILDDLQLADSASLELIKMLVTEHSTEYLLIIGTFIDNEITNPNPLYSWIDKIKGSGTYTSELFLKPLATTDISLLVSDTLKCGQNASATLSKIIHKKTSGNPFFIKNFLQGIYKDGILKFSYKSHWKWDIDQVEQMNITDNVVNLLKASISKLSGNARKALKYAACIGNNFDLEILAKIYGRSIDETYATIYELIQKDLILKTEKGYIFQHNTIQETAYSLIVEKEKKELHYMIGCTILKNSKPERVSELIFTFIDQLNLGCDIIDDDEKRIELANLNLISGQKAKASNAYKSANHYFLKGVELLPARAWQKNYDLTMSLFIEGCETGFLCRDYRQAEKFFNEITCNSKSPLDKVKAYEVKIAIYTTILDRREEAIQLGIKALSILGFRMPGKDRVHAIIREFITFKFNMIGKKTEDLADLPELTDPLKLTISSILLSIATAAYTNKPKYLFIIILKIMILSLKYGNSIYSAQAYSFFGAILCGKFWKIEEGYEFSNIALKVIDKFNDKITNIKTRALSLTLVQIWKTHIKNNYKFFKNDYLILAEVGDFEYASYKILYYITNSFFSGEPLYQVNERYKTYHEPIKKLKQSETIQEYELWFQLVKKIIEDTGERHLIKGDLFDENKIIPQWNSEKEYLTAMGHYTTAKIILLYLNNDPLGVIETAKNGKKFMAGMMGMFFVSVYNFYYSLALLAHYPRAGKKDQKEYMKQIKSNQKKMKRWSNHAPMNFMHKYLLIEAERTRLTGDTIKTMDLYDKAISLAIENGFLQEEAIANELAARFYLSINRDTIAQLYMQKAHLKYEQWGANLRVNLLQREYPELLSENIEKKPFAPHGQNQQSTGEMILEYTTIANSLQEISGEIIKEKLLKKLMLIAIESAGATRCVFISNKEDTLLVEAELKVDNNSIFSNDSEVTIIKPVPVEDKNDILLPIINSVKRTMKHIVIDNVRIEKDYILHPYVIKKQLKSILCLPIIRQFSLLGILYLENSITAGVFTTKRIEILHLLATHAAISFENAMLYEEIMQKEKARQESKIRYHNLFESVPVGVIISSIDGKILEANQSIFEIFKLQNEDTIDFNIEKFYSNPDALSEAIEILQDSNSLHEFEVQMNRMDGSSFSASLNISRFKWCNENVLLTVVNDITTRKRVEKKIRKLNEELEERVIERTKELQAMMKSMEIVNIDLNNAKNAIWGEMQIAKKIQTILLPQHPVIKSYDISVQMIPADDVGGDYYDIINIEGRDWLLIGDVSGHGVTAGLIMMLIKISILTIINIAPDIEPSKLLILINKIISKNMRKIDETMYMTITAVTCSDNGTFHFSGLHQDIMIYRCKSKEIEVIETNGTWIGIIDDIDGILNDRKFKLEIGDSLLLYTDGIIEAIDENENMFSQKRLEKVFKELGERDVDDIKSAILSNLKDYKWEDDISLVVMKRNN